MRGPSMLDENVAPRRFDERDRAAQLMGATEARLNSRRECVSIEAGETRQSRGALVGGQTRVDLDAALGGFVECAHARRMKRRATPVAQRELPRTADLLGQRAARRLVRRCE